MSRNDARARELADQCDRAAEELAAEAAELAGQDDELSARRYQMKTEAAETTRNYAADLRERADQAADADIQQAELVASTAQVGGITIDSGRMDGHDPARRQLQEDLVKAGLAEHVAEPGQVPYYRLTSTVQDDNVDEA